MQTVAANLACAVPSQPATTKRMNVVILFLVLHPFGMSLALAQFKNVNQHVHLSKILFGNTVTVNVLKYMMYELEPITRTMLPKGSSLIETGDL